MSELLRARDGLPRLARRLQAGEPVTMVAFGTSLTLVGAYLDRLSDAVQAAYPGARFNLINRGRNGYMTLGAAFRVDVDVLPHAPDVVLIEFAHNDGTPILVDFIPWALEGILGQVRAALPECEFVFVYLALPTVAAEGPTHAMRAYEAIASERGIPSIDLSALSEELVAGGTADWVGSPDRALTVDGVHHGPAAAGFLGEPFARAFLELLAAPAITPRPPPSIRREALTDVARVRAADCLLTGVWAVRPPAPGEQRGAGIDEEGLAEALEPGATLQLAFNGTNAYCWMSGSGVLWISIEPLGARYRVAVEAVRKWAFCSLMESHPRADYKVDVVALSAGLLFGDVCMAGTLSS